MCPTPSRWCGRPLTFYRSNGGTPRKLYAARVNLSRSDTNRRRGKSAGRPRRPLYGHDRLSFRRGRRPAVERSGTNALGVRRPVSRGSTYRPVGRGPCAPPPGTHFSAGHMGPALQVHTPQKNNAAPLAGRRAFSVHVWHRRRRVIFAAFTSGNREFG